MDDGWIKLYRKIQDWEWFDDSHMVHLFIYFLINANTKERNWRGIVIKRGQLVIGRKSLSVITGISERTIRTCLERFQKSGEIVVKSTNQFTLITISNYDNYNVPESESDQQSTSNRPTTDQRLTTPKELRIKNIINSSNEELRPPAGDRAPKEKKAKKTPSIVTKARVIFEDYFYEQYGEKYYWSAKDAVAMKRLLQKIKFSRTNRTYPLPVDDDSLCEAFGALLRSIDKSWIVNNFSVTKIDSQYNEIISEIKNRNHGSRQNTENLSDKRRGVEITATSAKDYEGAF